jgi:Kdo2-lipid IVA lauroyltransferase/acyltransferase
MRQAALSEADRAKIMRRKRRRAAWGKIRAPFVGALDLLFSGLARGTADLMRRMDPDKPSNLFGAVARRLGPWLPVSRVGRTNLAAAFPEKSAAEIEVILKGVWENLGRLAGEFFNLDRLWDFDPFGPESAQGRIRVPAGNVERFLKLRDDGKPALIFAAHLANWELPPICAKAYGLDAAVFYRPPNMKLIGDFIREHRTELMPRLVAASRAGVFALASELDRGAHVGLLVDQHRKPGVRVNFFGRQCWASPAIAKLAREYECPVHGTRVIRLPANRFRLEMTEEIKLPRDKDGKIDVAGAMQTITSVIEGWVREHPEQWLWLHKRWR